VYINLVKQVREAFEVCELVRVNCKGMNKSDFKKIGAKLQVCYLNVCLLFAEPILVYGVTHLIQKVGTFFKTTPPHVDIFACNSDESFILLVHIKLNSS
jgi:CRS1 / YhbY (CRM) domain